MFKKMLAVLIGALTMCACALAVSAQTTYSVPLSVKYGQTEARAMLDMVNDFRTGSDAWYWDYTDTQKVKASGLSKLQYDYGLEQAAMQRAAEIAASFAHTRPDGTTCFSVCDYNFGENIAAGYTTAKEAFVGWQETDQSYAGQGHRRNMLESGFVTIGIGHAKVNGIDYWVQEFGRYDPVVPEYKAPNDSTATVTINVSDDMIAQMDVKPSGSEITLAYTKSQPAPSVKAELLLYNAWPGYPIESEFIPVWTSNSSAVTFKDGNIIGSSIGNAKLTASVFGKTVTVNVKVACVHEWGSWNVSKPASCTESGQRSRKCSICGQTQNETIAPLGHKYVSRVIKPDYEKDGYTEYTCSVCGDSYKGNITSKLSVGKITKFSLKGRDASSLSLEWTKCSNADGYQLQIKKNGKWTTYNIKGSANYKYTVKGLSASVGYSLRVRGYKNYGGKTYYTDYKNGSANTTPSNMTGFKLASRGVNSVKLSWTKNTSASGYQVGVYKGGKWVSYTVKGNGTTSYTVSGLSAGTKYNVRVRAYKAVSGKNIYGAWKTGSVNTAPSNMTGFKLKSKTTSALTLQWSKNSSATGYQLQIKKDGKWVSYTIKSAKTTSYTIKSLAKNTKYSVRIRAYKTSGSSTIYGAWKTGSASTKK